jgi:hypothetical protein
MKRAARPYAGCGSHIKEPRACHLRTFDINSAHNARRRCGCCHAGVEQAADGIGRIGSFLAPAVVGYMLYYGAGHYVLHTFALTYLIAAIAVFLVGIETKGRVLEQITAAKPA